jgi:hypothetical protein
MVEWTSCDVHLSAFRLHMQLQAINKFGSKTAHTFEAESCRKAVAAG